MKFKLFISIYIADKERSGLSAQTQRTDIQLLASPHTVLSLLGKRLFHPQVPLCTPHRQQ